MVVRFSPTVFGVLAANVTFTSDGGDVSPAVTGSGRGVSAIIPNAVDLASPPATLHHHGRQASRISASACRW